jgi:hypothetical protein
MSLLFCAFKALSRIVSGLPVGGEMGASRDLAPSVASFSYFAESAIDFAASSFYFLTEPSSFVRDLT